MNFDTFEDDGSGDHTEYIECKEVDRGIQVMPQKTVSSTQTDYSFKRNKSVQHVTQKLTEKKVEKYMKSKKMTKFFHHVRFDAIFMTVMVSPIHSCYK